MLGLMESPLHHFFDDRTDAAALDALPGRPPIRLMVAAIGAAAVVESVVPEIVPRIVQRVTATS